MSEQSLRERITQYFAKRPELWINGRDIEELAMHAGYKASNASRRLRELHEERYLERDERKGRKVRSVWYKWQSYA
jgi:DNA-binding IclR family transcriptional regulator